MRKRFLGLVIAMILLITCVPTSAQLIDVVGTKYEKAVSLLFDLGILEGTIPDYFEVQEAVKRSDAAKVISKVSGVSATDARPIFEDVPADHPECGYIYLANQLGIVSGMGDGKFYPDTNITVEQATKMLVVLAGYKEHAEAAGGYPSGYLTKASQLNILNGISLAETFTKGAFALMVYNTLFVVPAEHASYGDSDGRYVTEGANVLEKFLHVHEVKGLVTANPATAIRGAKTREGMVAIEDVHYIANAALTQKIGRKVLAYYKENEYGEREILSFRDAADAITTEVDAKNILPETSNAVFCFEREGDGRKTSVSITSGTVVLYNGGVLTSPVAADFKPSQGTVYVTEEGSTASLIVVEEYEDYVVDFVNTNEEKLYFEDNIYGRASLDFERPSVYLTVTKKDGTPMSLRECQAGQILSVFFSRDGKVCNVIESSDTVGGTITEKTEDSILIEEKQYEFSNAFTDSLPNVGENVMVHLNFNGKIVDASNNVSSRQYGYLMAARFEGKGLSKVGKVKLLTMENEVVTLEAADNIRINDVTIGGAKLFNNEAVLTDSEMAEMAKVYQNDKAVEQVIVYELNAEGKLIAITTAVEGTYKEKNPDIFSLQYASNEASADRAPLFLQHGLRSFETKFHIPTSTIVFSVAASYTGDNDKQYKALTGSDLVHSTRYPNLKLYDLNEENEPAVLVTKKSMNQVGSMYQSNAVLVKSVGTAMMEDGTVCEAVTIVGAGGKEQVLYNPDEIEAIFSKTAITSEAEITEKLALSKLDPGDVIKFAAIDGVLTDAMVCFRNNSPKESEKGFDGTVTANITEAFDYFSALWVYAKVDYAGENVFLFSTPKSNGRIYDRMHTFGSATVLVYDKARNTVKVGTKASLVKGDMIFASRYNSYEHLIVIYR